MLALDDTQHSIIVLFGSDAHYPPIWIMAIRNRRISQEAFMKRLLFLLFALAIVPAYAGFNPFASKPKVASSRTGNVETIISKKDGKETYRILYTYDAQNRKIRGEYWEASTKKKDAKKAESNILAGTAAAKSYESALAKNETKDESGVVLDIEKDGFVLKNVRIVKYGANGLPSLIMARGYTTYPRSRNLQPQDRLLVHL